MLALVASMVGKHLICKVTSLGTDVADSAAERGREWRSPVLGPVEAAPPRCREVWIEGTSQVGHTLEAKCWYWGGTPGTCSFHWVRVSAEGDRKTYKARNASLASPCDATLPTGSAELPADGRLMPVTADDIGCKFKATVEPTRSDGMHGERTSSKPCSVVLA